MDVNNDNIILDINDNTNINDVVKQPAKKRGRKPKITNNEITNTETENTNTETINTKNTNTENTNTENTNTETTNTENTNIETETKEKKKKRNIKKEKKNELIDESSTLIDKGARGAEALVTEALVVIDEDVAMKTKRRGRKPKDKFKFESSEYDEFQKNSKKEDNIIIKLPLSCLKLNEEFNIGKDLFPYNPKLSIPKPYNSKHFISKTNIGFSSLNNSEINEDNSEINEENNDDNSEDNGVDNTGNNTGDNTRENDDDNDDDNDEGNGNDGEGKYSSNGNDGEGEGKYSGNGNDGEGEGKYSGNGNDYDGEGKYSGNGVDNDGENGDSVDNSYCIDNGEGEYCDDDENNGNDENNLASGSNIDSNGKNNCIINKKSADKKNKKINNIKYQTITHTQFCKKCTHCQKNKNNEDDIRQIDIILNNKYNSNTDKFNVLTHLGINLNGNKWIEKTDVACLFCCHSFKETPWGIPYKYKDGIFQLFGNFCLPNCALAHILQTYKDDDSLWEKVALLNLLYFKVYGKYKNLQPSFDKMALIMFGGTLEIDVYRNIISTNEKTYSIEFPPCNTIIPMLEEIYKKSALSNTFIPIDKNRINVANNELKLKRSKPIINHKNTLDFCLGKA